MDTYLKSVLLLICCAAVIGISYNLMSRSTWTGKLLVKKLNKHVPDITLMARLSSKKSLVKMVYCQFFRSLVLFWPQSLGDVVLVLDEEAANDRHLGDAIKKQIHSQFPEYTFNVAYEPLPKGKHILTTNPFRGLSYARQLWSTFFSDLYSNQSIIAYMDTDTSMLTPITKQHLIKGNKLKVFGIYFKGNPISENSVHVALGFPMVVDFMNTGFPQMMHRDTYYNCRLHIMKHLNTTNFEEAFHIFRPKKGDYSPVSILMNYAWYFEKHRYDWHLKVPSLNIVNSGLPEGHKVQPEDTCLSLVPIWHGKQWLVNRIKPGYCLTMAAQGQILPGCKNVTHNLAEICDLSFGPTWHTHGTCCKGLGYDQCCQQAVDEHYEHVRHMARMGVHTVQRKKAELVSTLAKEMGFRCGPLGMP